MQHNVAVYVHYLLVIQNCQTETQVASGAARRFFFCVLHLTHAHTS